MNNSPFVQIALADDHTLFRRSIAEMITSFGNFRVTLQAAHGNELLALLEKVSVVPQICILDINMPVMSGYETAAAIRARWPAMNILALSMYDNEFSIIKMLRNGACGYLVKHAEPEELKLALKMIVEKGYYHSEHISSNMLNLLQNKKQDIVLSISDLEIEFLVHCCSDLTFAQIAAVMKLSPRTIDSYRDALFKKLNIKSRTGLAVYAMKTGIVSFTDRG